MGYKNPEKQREAQARYMRERRAAAKNKPGGASPPGKVSKAIAGNRSFDGNVLNSKTKQPSPVSPTPVESAPAAAPDSGGIPKSQRPQGGGESTPESGVKDYSESELVHAHQVADKTRELIDSRGWVVWECSKLGGDRVVIIHDESVTGSPTGLPVYYEDEMEKVGDMSEWTLRMFHESKKIAQARLF